MSALYKYPRISPIGCARTWSDVAVTVANNSVGCFVDTLTTVGSGFAGIVGNLAGIEHASAASANSKNSRFMAYSSWCACAS